MIARSKDRVDALLVERGLAPSRAKAQALVLAGRVFSGEARVDKPGTRLDAGAPLRVSEGERYVSRGGYKLDGALEDLGVGVEGLVCVDVGASTGGFTDCLLQHGAAKVFAVDVGHGQLAASLQADPRVVVRDRTNARHLDAASFDEPIDLVVVDASFIGLGKLAPALRSILRSGGRLLALVKPQFEAGREVARRARGVLSDPVERERAIAHATSDVEAAGFRVLGSADSRLAGPKKNLEHFVLAEPLEASTDQSTNTHTS